MRSITVCLFLGVVAACGGSSSNNDSPMPDAPMKLPDDEPCSPGSQRCNGNDAQTCNAAGNHWDTKETCDKGCVDGVCAIDGLDVTTDTTKDGLVVIAGDLIVRGGATLTSPTGDLTIVANNITVELGGTISMTATGRNPDALRSDPTCTSCGVSAGFNPGQPSVAEVVPGGAAANLFGKPNSAALGGGTLRLLGKGKVVIAGAINASGGNGSNDNALCIRAGGGGGGGGVVVIGDDLTVTGSITTAGGLGGPTNPNPSCNFGQGQNGSAGFVKLLFGTKKDIDNGSVTGTATKGLAPPFPMRSTTHPDVKLIYNDGFLSLDLNWGKAFSSAMGYYVRMDTNPTGVPSPANANFVANEKVSFSPNDVADGDNYIHVASVDAMSSVGTVENVFRVRINTQPPGMTSSSHPSQTTFSNNVNPHFEWTYPQGDASVTGAYYVFDEFGDTVPTTSATMVPATQKQLLISNVPAGVHVLHVVAVDQTGRLTKHAGSYRVNIGADPGSGSVSGQVLNAQSQPVSGAAVTLNRGLISGGTTNSSGNFTIPTVPAGTWEVSARIGALVGTKMVTVTAGQPSNGNITVQ